MDLKHKKEKLIPLTKDEFVTAQTKIALQAFLYQLDQQPYIYKYYVNKELAKQLALEGSVVTICFPNLRNIKKANLYQWLNTTISKYGFSLYPSIIPNEIIIVFIGLKKSTLLLSK